MRLGFRGVLLALFLGGIVAWLVERTGNDYSPAFMIIAAGLVSLVALQSFRETYRAPLDAGIVVNPA